jgi:hypothetical protein
MSDLAAFSLYRVIITYKLQTNNHTLEAHNVGDTNVLTKVQEHGHV